MQMTLLDRMRERLAAAVAEIAAVVDAGAPPFVDLPGYDEAPDNRHVPGRRIPMAEAMAMITGAVDAMAAELASNLEICARALVAPDLLPSVLARESLAAEWPWLEGAWPRRLNTPKVEEWEAFGTLWKWARPQDVKGWPGTVAPTDAAEWARPRLNEWAPGFGDRLVEHTQAGRPMWTIVVQAGPDRATAPPYGLGLLYRTQREVITEKPDALEFLSALFATPGPGEIVIVPFDAKGKPKPRRGKWFPDATSAALAAVTADDAADGVYVGVARHIERDWKDPSVEAVTAAWVDIDPPKGDGVDLAAWRSAALQRITEVDPPPSIVASSGRGYHAYWLLKERADPHRVRAVNEALVARLDGGDATAVHVGRLMRVPGTRNRKDGAALYAGIVWRTSDRYYVTDLPGGGAGAMVPVRGSLGASTTQLLQRVFENTPGAVWGYDPWGRPKVILNAWCHEDSNASAVIFSNGLYFCSACSRGKGAGDKGVPASVWRRWPSVKKWASGVFIEGRASRVGRGGILKAPHSAEEAGWQLARRPVTAEQAAAGSGRLFARVIKDVVFTPETVAAVLKNRGDFVVRVFWLNVFLAQQSGDAEGRYKFSVTDACSRFGRKRGTDGRYPGSVQRKISAAQEALSKMTVKIKVGGKGALTENLVTPRGRATRGRRAANLYTLHGIIAAALRSRTPAWYLWHVDALRLDDEALAVYQYGQLQRSQRARTVIPLSDLAMAVGVWPESEAKRHPGETLRKWAARFEAAGPNIGFELDENTGEVWITPPREAGVAPLQLPARS